MIYELKPGEYEIARPIFKGLQYNLAIFSVIEGNTPGSVYVDDVADPKTAFVWDKSRDSGFYLEGYERNAGFNAALNRLIVERLYPEARTLPGVLDFTLHYFPETWEDQFGAVLRDTNPMKNWRKFYAFRQLKVDWRSMVPPGFVLRSVDGGLLARTGLRNADRLAHWAQDSWSSVDDFLARGLGFCLVHGDGVASWCMADYASGDRCEIGIHTDERYRRRGFATLTAAATVEHGISSRMPHVGWHCWGTNLASAATAEKVGFEKALDYPVYHAWFNAFDNCLVHGGYDLGRKRFRQSAEWYERAFQMADASEKAALESHWFSDAGDKAGCYYNAARAWALAGESEAAIRNLNRAIDSGWTDAEHLRTDEDLESLHGTQSWEDLMERLA